MAKNQAKAKQRPEAELLLFEDDSNSLSTLSTKNNRRHCKEWVKNKWVCFNPFMHVVKWPNIFQESCGVNTARFLKYFGHFATLCMKGLITLCNQ